MTNQSDATHAYRGYRKQAIYVLWRVLNDTQENLVFQPEGEEDLAIYEGDNLVEVVQVKARSDNLTLSTFLPDSPSSFFYRVRRYLQENSSLAVKLVSFGDFGQGFLAGLQSKGENREKLVADLAEKGFVSTDEAEFILEAVQPIQVSEQQLYQDIQEQIGDSLMGEPESAFQMLCYWIFMCSENKDFITRQDVIEKVNQVGKYINERAAHHREWYVTIVPLEDEEIDSSEENLLREQFYEGVSVRYKHILADLDVMRPQKLLQINESFKSSNVVILHGTSGQGKSALAYRYLRDYLPEQWRFFVHSPESRSQALSVARAISHHAKAINIPLTIYLDVKPSETDWTETVRELSYIPNIRVLVTIREDDLRRASFSAVDFQYQLLELKLDSSEAEEIYTVLVSRKKPSEFTDFDFAWERFGESGPLMEFVYLITKGRSLRDRLEQQVKAIEDEIVAGKLEKSAIDVLRLVALSSSFGARLNRQCLVEILSPDVPDRLFERLEKEYLIKVDKVDDEQFLIDGVHPIRSEIIKNLLTNEYINWEADFQHSLDCIYEPDVGVFLLGCFVGIPEHIKAIQHSLQNYQPSTWIGITGVTQSLLWLGVKHFVDRNEDVLREAYDMFGSILFLNIDIGGALPESLNPIEALGEIEAFKHRVEQANAISDQIEGRDEIFDYATSWLDQYSDVPLEPNDLRGWSNFAEGIFWIRHLEVDLPIDDWISQIEFEEIIPTLPLDVLADIGAAIGHNPTTSWHSQYEQILIEHFKEASNTMFVEASDEKAVLHYVLDVEGDSISPNIKDPIHYASRQRGVWFANLFPIYETISVQGYGHRTVDFDVFDSSVVNIQRKSLILKWLVWINSIYLGLVDWSHRPKDWQEHVDQVLKIRQGVVDLLTQYEQEVKKYFSSRNLRNLYKNLIEQNREFISKGITSYPLLPKLAVDPWGFNKEGANQNDPNKKILEPKGILIERFIPYWTALRKYFIALSNFFSHSQHALSITSLINHRITTQEQYRKFLEKARQHGVNENTVGVSINNLFDAWKELSFLQSKFRNLLLSFVDEKNLSRIERTERQAFDHTWKLWYFFAFEPYITTKNALSEFGRAFTTRYKEYKELFIDQLRLHLDDSTHVQFLSDHVMWDGEEVSIIVVDSSEGWKLFETLNRMLRDIVLGIFGDVNTWTIEFYTINIFMRSVLLLPLINGKLINQSGYPLRISIIAGRSKVNDLYFTLLPIPDDVMEQLIGYGFELHSGELIEVARKLQLQVANMYQIVSHVNDLANIPELDEHDLSALQTYIDRTTGKLSDVLHQTVQVFTQCAEMIVEYDFHNPLNLGLARGALSQLRQNLFINEIENGRIQIEQFEEWSKKLQVAYNLVFAFIATIASEEH